MSQGKVEHSNWKTQQSSMFEIVGNYIQGLHPGKKVDVIPKKVGDQLGCIARVFSDDDKPPLKYYIKTFSNGTFQKGDNWTVSPYAKPDLKEMFVYKALEYMGFGPKCHFISGTSKISTNSEYYLVTQDLSYTKDEHKQKKYTLFGDSGVDSKLKTMTNLLCLDLIIKTFRLSDVHGDNFGRMQTNERQKWHIHDFNLSTRKLNDSIDVFDDNILDIHNRTLDIRPGTYPCLTQFLDQHHTSINDCDILSYIQCAIEILNTGRGSTVSGNKCGFEMALYRSFEDIKNLVGEDDPALDELQKYYTGVHVNFVELQDKLKIEPDELVVNEIRPIK